MPSAAEILGLLGRMTSELVWLAAAWHGVVIVAVAAAWDGWRPSNRVAIYALLSLPASVSIAAFAYGNAFNGLMFALLAVALAVAARGARPALVAGSSYAWPRWLGAASLVFGLLYPHFVAGPWYRSAYAAPLGVVPCPTLAAIAGVVLLANGLGTRAVPALVASWAAFYAVFGIVRLGVTIDLGLLVVAVALAAHAVRLDHRRVVTVGP